jgi:hypothetical protein
MAQKFCFFPTVGGGGGLEGPGDAKNFQKILQSICVNAIFLTNFPIFGKKNLGGGIKAQDFSLPYLALPYLALPNLACPCLS